MDAVKFLSLCKSYYLDKRIPIKNGSLSVESTDEIVQVAQAYFYANKEEDFTGFFMESQYLVNLWSAHLLLDFGVPNEKQVSQDMDIVKRYSTTSLNEELANEEREWLKRNQNKK